MDVLHEVPDKTCNGFQMSTRRMPFWFSLRKVLSSITQIFVGSRRRSRSSLALRKSICTSNQLLTGRMVQH
jgi:hypothetical protein